MSALAQVATRAAAPFSTCRVWGHHADNRQSTGKCTDQSCACGDRALAGDGAVTRIRHVLSCFFGHHTYVRRTQRAGHNEYGCLDCGHPLLFRSDRDPHDPGLPFRKRVRYLCSLFGHTVAAVARRGGWTEYACGCGHTFLRSEPWLRRVHHPLACFFRGHFVAFLVERDGLVEYRCHVCGHPFIFGPRA